MPRAWATLRSRGRRRAAYFVDIARGRVYTPRPILLVCGQAGAASHATARRHTPCSGSCPHGTDPRIGDSPVLATSERVSLSLGSTEWPMPQRFVWAWLVAVAACWWAAATILLPQAVASQLGRTSPAAVPLALALSVLGRFAGFGIEAGFYILWWKMQQRRVRPACFFAWIATFSLLDFLGLGLGRLAALGAAWHLDRARGWETPRWDPARLVLIRDGRARGAREGLPGPIRSRRERGGSSRSSLNARTVGRACRGWSPLARVTRIR